MFDISSQCTLDIDHQLFNVADRQEAVQGIDSDHFICCFLSFFYHIDTDYEAGGTLLLD